MATPAPAPRSPWLRLRQQLYTLRSGGPAARKIGRELMMRLQQLHARHFPTDELELCIERELVNLEEQADKGVRGANLRLAAVNTDFEALIIPQHAEGVLAELDARVLPVKDGRVMVEGKREAQTGGETGGEMGGEDEP